MLAMRTVLLASSLGMMLFVKRSAEIVHCKLHLEAVCVEDTRWDIHHAGVADDDAMLGSV
jgi:hypothetical protein